MDFETALKIVEKFGLTKYTLAHDVNALLGTSYGTTHAYNWFYLGKDGTVPRVIEMYLLCLERSDGQVRPNEADIDAAVERVKKEEAEKAKILAAKKATSK